MKELIYNIIRKCDTPPDRSKFWGFVHFLFVIVTAEIGKFYLARLKKKHPDKKVVVFSQSSMGDVLITNRYFEFFKTIDDLRNTVIIFDIRLKKIVELFNFGETVFLSPYFVYSILQYNIVNYGVIAPLRSQYGFNENYIKYSEITLPPQTLLYNNISYEVKSNTVLVSPYERTLTFQSENKLSDNFWENLVEKLIDKNFNVVTNCSNKDDEIAIEKTESVFPKFTEIIPFCEKCNAVIAVRSGFADFAAMSEKTKMIVLYPNEAWIDEYGISKVWNKKNCLDITYEMIPEDELIEIIINNLMGD